MDDVAPVGPNEGGLLPHTSHWGVFSAFWQDGRLEVRPHPGDPDPNRIIENFPDALRHRARIARPMIRRGWLERGPGRDHRRGRDEFVEMEWDKALDLLALELRRVRDGHGPGAVFGGSYGWASAGRFHHAQSQIHRFLNTSLGGYVRSVNSYSSGASSVLLPHILGSYEGVTHHNVTWEQVNRTNKPRIVVVNKLDKENSDFYGAVGAMRDNRSVLHVPAEQAATCSGAGAHAIAAPLILCGPHALAGGR